jgi:hypothetical protein
MLTPAVGSPPGSPHSNSDRPEPARAGGNVNATYGLANSLNRFDITAFQIQSQFQDRNDGGPRIDPVQPPPPGPQSLGRQAHVTNTQDPFPYQSLVLPNGQRLVPVAWALLPPQNALVPATPTPYPVYSSLNFTANVAAFPLTPQSQDDINQSAVNEVPSVESCSREDATPVDASWAAPSALQVPIEKHSNQTPYGDAAVPSHWPPLGMSQVPLTPQFRQTPYDDAAVPSYWPSLGTLQVSLTPQFHQTQDGDVTTPVYWPSPGMSPSANISPTSDALPFGADLSSAVAYPHPPPLPSPLQYAGFSQAGSQSGGDASQAFLVSTSTITSYNIPAQGCDSNNQILKDIPIHAGATRDAMRAVHVEAQFLQDSGIGPDILGSEDENVSDEASQMHTAGAEFVMQMIDGNLSNACNDRSYVPEISQGPGRGMALAAQTTVVRSNNRAESVNAQTIMRRSLDTATIRKDFRNGLGELNGTMMVFGAKQKSRSSLDPKARGLVAIARRIGVCPRCHRRKKPCRYSNSKYMPCDRCLGNSRILDMPCTLQIRIHEIELLRCFDGGVDVPENPLNFMHRIGNWPTGMGLCIGCESSLEIQLTQDMGSVMSVAVCRYVPLERDTTGYSWTDVSGTLQTMEMPPICIASWQDAKAAAISYAKGSMNLLLKSLLESCDPLTRDTFIMARISKDRLVRDSLMLWTSCRVTEKTWQISGRDTLGLKPVQDKANPWHGIIPVTPIMDAQLDEIFLVEILMPLRDRVLAELKSRLSDPQKVKADWFSIYLTLFVLLSNLEAQNAHDRQFAKRYGLKGRFWGTSVGRYPLWEIRLHSARTILAHFHHVCRGPAALSLSRRPPPSSERGGEDTKSKYLEGLKGQINRRTIMLQELRTNHRYESELYWGHQMFFEGWEPGHDYVVELLEQSLEI